MAVVGFCHTNRENNTTGNPIFGGGGLEMPKGFVEDNIPITAQEMDTLCWLVPSSSLDPVLGYTELSYFLREKL